ncbi:hypothetical protein GQ43DRAFT_359494, partial [Delitschia confertaspora ATCC 74209]
SWYRRHEGSIIVHVTILMINLIICIWYTKSISQYFPSSPVPARNVIKYEARKFDMSPVYFSNGTLNPNKPPFGGPPREELSQEWEHLLQNHNLFLRKSQLKPFENDENLVGLSNNSGYLTTLTVFHALHCVKRLHHYLYKDSYYPNMSTFDDQKLQHHIEHCVDLIRQYIQCNVDTTIIPFHWVEGKTQPVGMDMAEHQCVDWNMLDSWAGERSFDPFEPGVLVVPGGGD